MHPMVVHCKKEKYDVYIGRANPRSGLKASPWANPLKIRKDGAREEVMGKYRSWLPVTSYKSGVTSRRKAAKKPPTD